MKDVIFLKKASKKEKLSRRIENTIAQAEMA